ncbi:hypothetical protein LCGC14_1580590 [marine sediment metagenome]|uniref:Uncharacterized protein n=1 Tax=marine sediment metagenome TaxID=412755 RepID=A0A0F9LH63_9ZZZZ
MACECSIAGLFDIEFDGIISAQITGSSEFIDILSQCDTGPNILDDVRRRLKGPSIGTINLTAYAFLKGGNRYLGTSCPSTAGISFPTQQRFDCENNITRIIRTKTGEAFREGDPINGLTVLGEFCSFRTVNASAAGGPASTVTDTERFLGSDIIWTGPPIAFDSRDVDTLDVTILGLEAKMTQFSVNVTVPGIGTNSYTFQYSVSSCEGDLF